MFAQLFQRLTAVVRHARQVLRRQLLIATKPAAAPVLVGSLADLTRSTPALVLEHALLQQQLVILHRNIKHPCCTQADRALLVLLASLSWPISQSVRRRAARS